MRRSTLSRPTRGPVKHYKLTTKATNQVIQADVVAFKDLPTIEKGKKEQSLGQQGLAGVNVKAKDIN